MLQHVFGCEDPEMFVDYETTKHLEAQRSEIDLKVFIPTLFLQLKILLRLK